MTALPPPPTHHESTPPVDEVSAIPSEPSPIAQPPGRPPPTGNKVVLKLKVSDLDRSTTPSTPDAMAIQQKPEATSTTMTTTTPMTATTTTTIKQKSGLKSKAASTKKTPRRPRRGRPRNSSLIAAAEAQALIHTQAQGARAGECGAADAGMNVSGTDGAIEGLRAYRDMNGDVASLEFRFLSELSFPVLASTAVGSNTVGQLSAPAPSPLPQQPPPPPGVRRCACCGVAAPTTAPSAMLSLESRHRNPTSGAHLDLNLQPGQSGGRDDLSKHPKPVAGRGAKANTLAFWYDVSVARQATVSTNLDFKMFCLGLIWDRQRGDLSEDEIAVRDDKGIMWDLMLRDAVATAKIWRKVRKWMVRERETAAKWAVWEGNVRRRSLGGFSADDAGAWLVRAPGVDGEVRKILCLGYKRDGIVRDAEESGGSTRKR